MKKLKKFQKFALSAEQASKVKGGIRCHAGAVTSRNFIDAEKALEWCNSHGGCVGCF